MQDKLVGLRWQWTVALILGILCVTASAAFAREAEDELPRRAAWDARFSPHQPVGMTLTEVNENSALAKSGFQVGDIFLAVDGRYVNGSDTWYDITDALTAGKAVSIRFRRDHRVLEKNVTFAAVPKEKHEGITTEYGVIESDYGVRQRTILTYPDGIQAPMPGILFIQGLSCSSIEIIPGRDSNYVRKLNMIVENVNMAFMRVEKPGLGDSEGDCSKTDFATELNGYEHALRALLTHPGVDPNRVIVFGSSMGSAIAPYLVNKYSLNGVISDGTFFRSWFEHMLEIERRIKQMQGLTEAQITQQMNQAYIPMYYGMLVDKKSYGELVAANPLLAQYNYHSAEHMYGRPMTYYHQVQDFDFAGNWQQVSMPVRIRYGEHDWIMSESDNHMIVDAIKRAGNDDVELYIQPGLDHWATLHPNPTHSFERKPGKWDDSIAMKVVEWAQEINSDSHRSSDLPGE